MHGSVLGREREMQYLRAIDSKAEQKQQHAQDRRRQHALPIDAPPTPAAPGKGGGEEERGEQKDGERATLVFEDHPPLLARAGRRENHPRPGVLLGNGDDALQRAGDLLCIGGRGPQAHFQSGLARKQTTRIDADSEAGKEFPGDPQAHVQVGHLPQGVLRGDGEIAPESVIDEQRPWAGRYSLGTRHLTRPIDDVAIFPTGDSDFQVQGSQAERARQELQVSIREQCLLCPGPGISLQFQKRGANPFGAGVQSRSRESEPHRVFTRGDARQPQTHEGSEQEQRDQGEFEEHGSARYSLAAAQPRERRQHAEDEGGGRPGHHLTRSGEKKGAESKDDPKGKGSHHQ